MSISEEMDIIGADRWRGGDSEKPTTSPQRIHRTGTAMKQNTTEQFVATYTNDDSAISFRWNGKNGEEFVDQNAAFRDAVLGQVLRCPADAPLPLVVDLYRALTEQSVESWGIDSRVEDLGKLMLTAGRGKVARDYVVGSLRSFDAHCGTSFEGCPRDVAEECVELAQSKIRSETDEDELAIWTAGLGRFNLLLEHSS